MAQPEPNPESYSKSVGCQEASTAQKTASQFNSFSFGLGRKTENGRDVACW